MFQLGSPLESVQNIYLLAVALLLGLVLEAFHQWKIKAWALPALAVYTTVAIWYFLELFYTPERFLQFHTDVIEASYIQIILFLITFRGSLTTLTRLSLKNYQKVLRFSAVFNPDRLIVWVGLLWLCLLGYGVFRLDGDIVNALFPIAGRAGRQMWGRAALSAGNAGFIISSAAYTYTLTCAFIGILLPLKMSRHLKLLNIVLACLALPYFIFMGARNQLLAVIMPGYFSYAIFFRDKAWRKLLVSLVIFIMINQLMTVIISSRNSGFEYLFSSGGAQILAESNHDQKHEGLNMLEELCYINTFYGEGRLDLTYGGRYFAEIANIVPRPLWPNKPAIGIEYAVLRGFGGANNDIGVFATVSTGLIGQGFYNFGPIFGPMAAAVLMATWAGWLSRLWMQQYSVLRLCLFLVGIGLTFNLGREMTLLVLWPIVFGYALVRFLEYFQKN
jgi:hypothetical protein